MRHPESTAKVETLVPGMQLEGGPIVIEAGPVHPDGEGSFAWRVCILLIADSNPFHPFTVHNVYYDDEREHWQLQTGNYARDITEALEYFGARTPARA